MAALPIQYREVLNLQQMGIAADAISFKTVTMNNFDTIIVNNTNELIIINTASRQFENFTATVESAIMNPKARVMGLRAASSSGGAHLQIYNLEIGVRSKVANLDEAVTYWKWLDQKTVAIVTDSVVYHWEMAGDSEPSKQFNRQTSGVQILNYERSSGGDWLLLRGIKKENNAIVGKLTVHQISTGKDQTIDAHGGCFATVTLPNQTQPSTLLCFARSDGSGTKLFMKEIEGAGGQFLNTADIPLTNAGDFIVSMVPDEKHGFLFALSQHGFLFLFDLVSGLCVFDRQISQTMFLSVSCEDDGGVYALDRNGRLLSFSLDEANIVNHINGMGSFDIGVSVAARCNLSGAEDVFKQKFQMAMQAGQFKEAAQIAAKAPQGVLRTTETIRAFQNAPIASGQQFPDLVYFQLLLETETLTKEESIGLCKRVLSISESNGITHVEKWLTNNKLTHSEELGDVLVGSNVKLACSVYLHGNVPEKTILCFLNMGHWDKVQDYAKKNNYTPNYHMLLGKLLQAKREDAKPFALMLSANGEMSPQDCVQIFIQAGDIESAVGFLLKYLQSRGDREEDADLQTKLLEMALTGAPQIVDAIMDNPEYQFTKYDRLYIARMCESAGLYQRALEHYEVTIKTNILFEDSRPKKGSRNFVSPSV